MRWRANAGGPGLARAGAGAGDQPPGAPEHGEDSEGDGETDRPEHEQEDHEGDDGKRDEEEFHGCVVLQWRWERLRHLRPW